METTAFTNRLQKLLEYYDLSASGFATKIGVQRSSISHVLSGRNKPSLDFVMKLLHTFPEVTIEWLIDGHGSFPKTNTPPTLPFQDSVVKEADNTSLFNDQSVKQSIKKTELNIPQTDSEKTIAKVILLYTDGSFEYFKN